MKRSVLILLACCLVTVDIYSQNVKGNIIEKSFDFNESFHCIGFSAFMGINFAPKLQDHSGEIKPILSNSFVPEFILQYNFMIKNGLGIALEVPFGIFSRSSLTVLSDYGASNDVYLEMGSLYVGFIAKMSVFKELNKNVCMQGEMGLKFNPFFHSANKWENKYYDVFNTNNYEIEEDNSSINFTMVEQKYYAIPDATVAVLFFFHSSKKMKHNFVLGFNFNLSFVKRIKVTYDTSFSELGINQSPNVGWGKYGWDSTSIGVTFGYRFFGMK